MNKNLKKVISSVVALALSLGSLSAFAASYTDVAETANYATAVNELSALGIVNGYEDGTFQPDKKVTRAEVTKMVVAALAQTAAADAAKGATAFSDVTADHWASGFINVGSNSTGFINGMGDGTFAPEANVTYAQLVKMLVTSLGYGGMALQEGGYPTGYLTVGDRIGVTKSVVANANDELTREQVARLIDNSINLPLLVTTVWSAANPEYEIKDDKGKGFQSLLTEYHNTYKVEGKIVETSKSSSSGLDPDEARFEIVVADRFDDDEWVTRNDDPIREIVKVANGIDAAANLFSYSTALLYKNDDDEYELISLSSSAKSKTVELSAGAFDEKNKAYKGSTPEDVLENYSDNLFYYATDAKTGKVTEYKLADGKNDRNEAELWVNGVNVSWNSTNLYDYLVDNNVGTVTLVDAPQNGKSTTDGYYDYVLVSYYKSAMVSDVMSDGVVHFDVKEKDMPNKIEFDQDKVEDGDLQYTITLDGKEIDYKDLQEDDVVAIAFDVTADSSIEKAFTNSEFYDVIVTRGTVEGKVTSEDDEDEFFTVGGTNYKYDYNKLPDGYDSEAVGMDATLYVDAFGRIVYIEETSSSKKFAILENVYLKTGEDAWYAKIVLPDGTSTEYEIKDWDKTSAVSGVDVESKILKDVLDIGYDSYTYTSKTNVTKGNKADIWDRVITYKVNSSNLIYDISTNGNDMKPQANKEYDADNNKVGSVKMNDNTVVLDASDYISSEKISDLKKVSSFVDGTEYSVYGYDKLSDGTYAFVLVVDGFGGYNDDTQLAVFVKNTSELDSEGDSKDAATVIYNGEQKSYILDGGSTAGLSKGDIIIMKINSSNEVEDIKVVAQLKLFSGSTRNAFLSTDLFSFAAPKPESVTSKWDSAAPTKSEVELDFGVITDKSSSSVTLVPYNASTSTSVEKEWDINKDTTKVYIADFSEDSDKNTLKIGTISDITKTAITKNAKDSDDNIYWESSPNPKTGDYVADEDLNFAFVKAVDGDVTEIIVIVAP